MKCLHYARYLNKEKKLRKHYETVCNVNKQNYFYQALFKKNQQDNYSLRKCFRCDAFILKEKQERKHNFLKHLEQGGSIPDENLPVIRESDSTITKLSMNYDRHKDYYNFEKPSELIENFFFCD